MQRHTQTNKQLTEVYSSDDTMAFMLGLKMKSINTITIVSSLNGMKITVDDNVLEGENARKVLTNPTLSSLLFNNYLANPTIKKLKLFQFTGCSQEFVQSYLKKTSLTSLTLESYQHKDPKFGTVDLNLILQHIKSNTSLEEIYLDHNVAGYSAPFEAKFVDSFASAIQVHPKLKLFKISGTTIVETKELNDGMPAALLLHKKLNGKVKTGFEDLLGTFIEEKKLDAEHLKKEIQTTIHGIYNLCKADYPVQKILGLSRAHELMQTLFEDNKNRILKITKADRKGFSDTFDPVTEKKYNEANRGRNIKYSLGAYFKNFSELKISEHSIESLSGKASYDVYIIILKETKGKKHYFLAKKFKELADLLCKLEEIMPHSAIENYQTKAHRTLSKSLPDEDWSPDWDLTAANIYCHYQYVNDPMLIKVVQENFEAKTSNYPKKITVVDVGGGKARVATKIIPELIKLGHEVDYTLIEQSEKQCTIANEVLANLSKNENYKGKFKYHVIPKRINQANLSELEHKAHLVIASGIFTYQVCNRFFDKNNLSESEAERDLKLSVNLLATNGLIINTGLRPVVFVEEEFEKLGLKMIRKVFKYKTENGVFYPMQCYVGRKIDTPALKLVNKSFTAS